MAGHSVPPCIVWFRDDLRLCDHPALHAASKTGAPVICLYVFDEASDALCGRGARPLGGAACWWRSRSGAVQNSLNAVGASLVQRKGPAAPIIAGQNGVNTRNPRPSLLRMSLGAASRSPAKLCEATAGSESWGRSEAIAAAEDAPSRARHGKRYA